MCGERGIVLSKRIKIGLKICLSIFIGILCFFWIYAYRNEVLTYISKDDYHKYLVDDKSLEELKEELQTYDASNKDYFKINQLLNKKLKDYSYSLSTSNAIAFFHMNQDSYEKNYESNRIKEQPIKFHDGSDGTLVVRANLQTFYKQYIKILLLGVSILIVLLYYIFTFIEHKELIKRILKKLEKIKFMNKLSFQLICINIISGLLAIFLYFMMYTHRYAFFAFLRDTIKPPNLETMIMDMNSETKDIEFKVENNNQIQNIIEKYQFNYTDVILYSQDTSYLVNTKGYVSQSTFEGFFINQATINTPMYHTYILNFKNSQSLVLVYYFSLYKYVLPYIITIIALAVAIYILPLFWFIQNKVKAICTMQEDIVVLAGGNLDHSISEIGNDEIYALGKELNSMRKSFQESMNNEIRLRESNKELITSMSHDLRTPLTSLIGYLDIVRLGKGDGKQTQQYLEKAMDKAHQIRILSDEMFEYFLVYGQDEKVDLTCENSSEWELYVEESAQLLQIQGYTIIVEFDKKDRMLKMNKRLMKRVIDNLFSNILKYAEINSPILIRSEVRKGNYYFYMKNTKQINTHNIESNQIGLKSVKKILEIHGGEVEILSDKDFMIVLKLPL